MENLPKRQANHSPLTPLTFLTRAAAVYAHRTSLIYGGARFTWLQTRRRTLRLAAALRSRLAITKNDVVSVLAPNVPALYEMHFAVPMAGAVLNAINTRLDARSVAGILRHSEAKAFFVDYEFVALAGEALRLLQELHPGAAVPLIVLIDDVDSPTGAGFGEVEYEQLVAGGDGDAARCVDDEWDPISVNYTSGTTSAPKAVVYSHRGAYLSSLAMVVGWEMGHAPVYLWTLPMFHCNGWTFTWGVAARGGVNVCIRRPISGAIYRSIAVHGVTHMCCAPVVLHALIDGAGDPQSFTHRRSNILADRVNVLVGGAPPPPALLEKIEAVGFRVTHAYGMTEATGPALVCEWQPEWDRRAARERARLKARQGVSVLSLADVDVKDPSTMRSVARDGRTVGEIVIRGSGVMKGYLKDAAANARAFREDGGVEWFLTGDVAVVHGDGYVEIKDRSKDVIISGGENISSVEVEAVLYAHPAVREAAVVAMPHPRWGESPCAFVTAAGDVDGGPEEAALILSHCRKNLAGFMVPKKVVFLKELPKTSTGKVQKFQLRSMAAVIAAGDQSTGSSRAAVSQPDQEQLIASRL